jgi:hypothetical protein
MVLVAARVLEAEPEILTTSLFSKIFMFLNAMKRSDFHAKVSAVSLGIRIIHSQIWEDDEFILHGKIYCVCDKFWLSACLLVDINDDLRDINGVSDDGIYFF